jgi:hypothetical protein
LKSTWDILEIVIGGGTCQVFNWWRLTQMSGSAVQ